MKGILTILGIARNIGANKSNGHGVMLTADNVEAATVFEPFPAETSEAFRQGRVSTEEFVDALIQHVKADMAKRDNIAP